MAHVIVGLGNPGEGYRDTRHNAGRIAVERFAKEYGFPPFTFKASSHASVSKGEIDGTPVTLVLPEVAMNLSGKAVLPFVKSVKAAKQLLVVRDDLDLPVGSIKVTVHGRGSGGQKGVESIMAALKTKDFMQLKLGISPAQKPEAGDAVVEHVLGSFRPAEHEQMTAVCERASEAMRKWVAEGPAAAMLTANTAK